MPTISRRKMPAFVIPLPPLRTLPWPTLSPKMYSLSSLPTRLSLAAACARPVRASRRVRTLSSATSDSEPEQDEAARPKPSVFGAARRMFGVGAGTGDTPYPPPDPNDSNRELWTADEVDVAAEALSESGKSASSSAAALTPADTGIDVQRASRALWKVGWFTWWTQLVLTVVSAVICSFALIFPGVNARASASAAGTVLAGAGVSVAFVSLFWTYGYTRLAIKLRRGHPKFMARAPDRVAGYLRAAVVLAVAGLVISLVGLQAIVGTLLARLLGAGIATTPYTAMQANTASTGNGMGIAGVGGVQPVDVLVIQATANAMSALVAALIAAIWLRARLRVWTGTKSAGSSNGK
jgi:Protein of unknown function (DUF3611)